MSLQTVPLVSFDFSPSRPVQIEVSPAPLTSDAGLLPVRQLDQHIRLTEQFAAALDDRRDPALTRQSLLSMVRQRVYGILADYEDQNDHDTLRSDPAFKLLADRLPDDPDLASQPTLSRFENAVSIPDLWRLRDMLVDLFLQSFDAPPRHLTLDLDAFDDPAHGQQQLIMFHGYYEQYQYLPIVITCAENDMALLVGLRHGTCHASLGADNDLRYLMLPPFFSIFYFYLSLLSSQIFPSFSSLPHPAPTSPSSLPSHLPSPLPPRLPAGTAAPTSISLCPSSSPTSLSFSTFLFLILFFYVFLLFLFMLYPIPSFLLPLLYLSPPLLFFLLFFLLSPFLLLLLLFFPPHHYANEDLFPFHFHSPAPSSSSSPFFIISRLHVHLYLLVPLSSL